MLNIMVDGEMEAFNTCLHTDVLPLRLVNHRTGIEKTKIHVPPSSLLWMLWWHCSGCPLVVHRWQCTCRFQLGPLLTLPQVSWFHGQEVHWILCGAQLNELQWTCEASIYCWMLNLSWSVCLLIHESMNTRPLLAISIFLHRKAFQKFTAQRGFAWPMSNRRFAHPRVLKKNIMVAMSKISRTLGD